MKKKKNLANDLRLIANAMSNMHSFCVSFNYEKLQQFLFYKSSEPARGVFKIMSNIYHGAFFVKTVNSSHKSSITDVWKCPKNYSRKSVIFDCP